MTRPRFNRILLKLSGEVLMGPGQFGIDPGTVARIAGEIAAAQAEGHQLCLVVGGGNMIRGARISSAGWIDRATGDSLGMIATVMNSLALETALNAAGVPARTMSAVSMPTICETYARQPALHHLDKGQVVVLAGGTGNPFFTTDSAAALRAAEMGAQAIFKGTQVDGIYSADPKKDPTATRFDQLTHSEVLSKGLAVMDIAAVALAQENNIPIIVFSIHEKGGFAQILTGGGRKTIVTGH